MIILTVLRYDHHRIDEKEVVILLNSAIGAKIF